MHEILSENVILAFYLFCIPFIMYAKHDALCTVRRLTLNAQAVTWV